MPAAPSPRESTYDPEELISALDHLPAMVAYWDSDLRNHIANAAYREWFGIDPADMRGMHIRDLLGPEVYERNLPYIRGALAGEQQLFSRTLIDASGKTRYTQASYVPHVVNGDVHGFFVLVTDITERVQAESALQESVANVALLQERQRISADMHDLVIQGLFAATLELHTLRASVDGPAVDRVDSVLDRVDAAITNLRSAIRGLSRTIDPQQFIADVSQVLDAGAKVLGFTPALNVDGPPELIPAPARPEMLAVLTEALSNTARHSGATAVTVTISMIGPEVRLLIADNGVGIRNTGRRSGLDNIKMRAERLGGTSTIASNDPHGVIIDWRVPSTVNDEPIAVLPLTGSVSRS